MSPEPRRFPWPKWPFYLADAVLVILAARIFLQAPGRIELWTVVFLVVALATGAFLSLAPHLHEAGWAWRDPEAMPPAAGADPSSVSASSDPGEVLAEIATLTWRILRRAEKDPEANRVILRNAGKIIEALDRCGVEIVSYLGRRIDVGSNVQILDAVEGEYNRVLEESEPQVQRHGRLLRRAVVTIGKGEPSGKTSI